MKYKVSHKVRFGNTVKYFRFTIKADAGRMIDAINIATTRIDKKMSALHPKVKTYSVSIVSAAPVISLEDL